MKGVDPTLYNKEYFLKNCSGYVKFNNSNGKKLDERYLKIFNEMGNVKGKKILDLGCGRGEFARFLYKKGAKVVGIDYSGDAIKLASTTFKNDIAKSKGELKYLKMNTKNLKLKSMGFDMCVSIEVYEHLYPKEKDLLLGEVYRVLKPDGKFYLHTEPNIYFNSIFYPYWIFPVGSLLIKINNFLFHSNYPPMIPAKDLVMDSKQGGHVGEDNIIWITKRLNEHKFRIKKRMILNYVWTKPVLSWKDIIFNLLVFLHPISKYFPFNILFGQDFLFISNK